MYNEIFDFCKIRNKGSIYENGYNPTPRVDFILRLLKNHNIPYTLDKFNYRNNNAFNIILKGKSDKMVIAHHDIVNPTIDNANDNSASVINAISLKKLMPEINVVLTDGEEVGGVGSQRLSNQIKENNFGNLKWILNLELTGKGGENFFIGNEDNILSDHIIRLYDCPKFDVIFNDSYIMKKNGIVSNVINPLPITNKDTGLVYKGNNLDTSLLYNCHTSKDNLSTISVNDMKLFTENILTNILS